MEKRRHNQTQAITKGETIERRICIGQDEWKTTKSHWNEALRDEKTLQQHNNTSIKATKRTLICSTDDSTMVAKHLTESYIEWGGSRAKTSRKEGPKHQ
jgi:hypothetical protein